MDTSRKNLFIETFGWYGVAAILAAYILISFGVISSDNVWYQILNITGSVGILTDAFNQRNYQPAVLNVVWAVVGLIALARIFI